MKNKAFRVLKEKDWVFKGEELGVKGEKLGMPFSPLNVVEKGKITTQKKENRKLGRDNKGEELGVIILFVTKKSFNFLT